MSNNHTIPRQPAREYDRNYEIMRDEGLRYARELSRKLWTDYNLHDPGITILELLCYAISDLGYRTSLPIEDLLAEKENNKAAMNRKFPPAESILPTCPLTEYDYRKIFIDLEGVRNAWVMYKKIPFYLNCDSEYEGKTGQKGFLTYEKPDEVKIKEELRGYYKILILPDRFTNNGEEVKPDKLKKQVTQRYHRNRNLCEDLLTVETIPETEVSLCADLEIVSDAVPEEVHAKIKHAVSNYFNPPVRRKTLSELLDEGQPIENIFEGPLLKNGFITDEDLKKAALRTEVRLSDIIEIIMSMEEVKIIKDIEISLCEPGYDEKDDNPWIVCIPPGTVPVLCEKKTVLNFYKDVLPQPVNAKDAEKHLEDLFAEELEEWEEIGKAPSGIPVPEGKYFAAGQLVSLRQDFPDNYGINTNGLPADATPERKAQALQLKGYIHFFDRILSGYFAHLEQVKKLLSAENPTGETYFFSEIEGFDNNPVVGKDYQQTLEQLRDHLDKNRYERNNRFLDHLIARFAENFHDYASIMFRLYRKEEAQKKLAEVKAAFIKTYPETGKRRFTAINYRPGKVDDPSPEEMDALPCDTLYEPSGLETRIASLAGDMKTGQLPLFALETEISEDKKEVEGEEIKVYRWSVSGGDKDAERSLHSVSFFKVHRDAEDALWETVNYVRIDQSKKQVKDNLASKEANGTTAKYRYEASGGNYKVGIYDKKGRLMGFFGGTFANENEIATNIAKTAAWLHKKMEHEGMLLIEHLLLAPDPENAPPKLFFPVHVEPGCTSCDPADPYSFRLTIALPGWTERFSDMDFRTYMEKLIRLETPAHIAPKICWIGPGQMQDLQEVYARWLKERRENTGEQASDETLEEFINVIGSLHSIYPKGRLFDCDDNGDDPVILNRTNLGNI